MKNILAIAPLKPEFTALCCALQESGLASEQPDLLSSKIIYFPALRLYCAHGGFGSAQFAAKAKLLINELSIISTLLCVGTAGAIDESLDTADVVVGVKTIEYCFSKSRQTRQIVEFAAAHELVKKFGSYSNSSYAVHLADIASGDENVVSAQRVTEVKELTGAKAVAWEGAAAAKVALSAKLAFLELRTITDRCNGQTKNDFKKNLTCGMKNIADLLSRVLILK